MMELTVKDVSEIAGVSRRTLHYYDEIGLLKPTSIANNRYRYYEKEALLRLQQILFYREMDFSLKEIKVMMDRPDYDVLATMLKHRKALKKRMSRLNKLIDTLDQTISHLKGETELMSKDLFNGFDEATQEVYAEEAARRWDAEKVKVSNRRWKGYSESTKNQIMAESQAIHQDLLANMDEGHDSDEIQAIVERWFTHIRYFYEPTLAIFRGLAQGYEEDPQFAAFYKKLHTDMPGFFRRAIEYYCDQKELT